MSVEQDLLVAAVALGLSQRELGAHFDCSQTTIRYWLDRYGLKTTRPRHPPLTYDEDGEIVRHIERRCSHHGVTTFVYEPSKKGYRCKRCRTAKISEDRRKLKRRLVAEAGGCCSRCGYRQSFWAMHFHHRDPAKKEREIAHLVRDRNYFAAVQEIAKCDLVCANCHAELEEMKWAADGSAV